MSEKRKENFSIYEKIYIDFIFQNKNIFEDKSNSIKNKMLQQEKRKIIVNTISLTVARDWKDIRGAY